MVLLIFNIVIVLFFCRVIRVVLLSGEIVIYLGFKFLVVFVLGLKICILWECNFFFWLMKVEKLVVEIFVWVKLLILLEILIILIEFFGLLV